MKKNVPGITHTEILSYAWQYVTKQIEDNKKTFGENANALNALWEDKKNKIEFLYELENGNSI